MLVPISYCIYLDAEIKNSIEDYRYLNSKAFVLENKIQYEESINYNT